MDSNTCVYYIVNASIQEIDDVLNYINEEMQTKLSGVRLIKAQDCLVSAIKVSYENIYYPAHEFGTQFLFSNGVDVNVRNAVRNLKKAYEFFENPPVIQKSKKVREENKSKKENEELSEVNEKDNRIIQSIGGLAKVLGCGRTKANEVTQTHVLVRAGVQYLVGMKWYYNKQKLEDFIKNNPDAINKALKEYRASKKEVKKRAGKSA